METDFETIKIQRREVWVDSSLNSRKYVDPKRLDKLVQSIKIQGLMQPCVIIKTQQMGKNYKDLSLPYILICGFRRQAAMDIIHGDEYEMEYRLAPSTWTIEDAIAANLTENLAREDLTTFEIAQQCVTLRDQFGMSAKDIAHKVRAHDSEIGDKKPLSESHINNLMRCIDNLHETILAAWKDGHPKASLRVLIQLAAEKDQEIQLQMWLGIENPHLAAEIDEVLDAKDRKIEEKEEKPTRRPTMPQLTSMMIAIREAIKEGKKSEEWGKGAMAAMRYAAGMTPTVSGIKPGSKSDNEEE